MFLGLGAAWLVLAAVTTWVAVSPAVTGCSIEALKGTDLYYEPVFSSWPLGLGCQRVGSGHVMHLRNYVPPSAFLAPLEVFVAVTLLVLASGWAAWRARHGAADHTVVTSS